MDRQHPFRGNDTLDAVADRAELVARYKRLRAAERKLSDKLVARLPKDVLEEGARKLGMFQGGIFVFERNAA